MNKIAFLTGTTGQDGSYLAESLLADGYEVHGLMRRSSSFNTARIDHLFGVENFHLHYGDLTDGAGLGALLAKIRPNEIYNLGAQSHVRVSFDCPSYTVDSIVAGTLNLLEAYRQHCPEARFYQASSSEMFGAVVETPQKETTPFRPQSPYACAKLCAHHLVQNYRASYGLHASCGILFNHESPRRGETFVTRKITKAVARILADKQKEFSLGNLEAMRDWGYAKEFVGGMRLMLAQDAPGDYVLATGETHTVREFVDEVFRLIDRDPAYLIKIDQRLFRPAEVDLLLGDPTKAKEKLGWVPKTTFKELVRLMLESDMNAEGLTL